ncbi:MAG: hypothetical protein KDA52_03665 [Planctomycetaceae bacterium]|nr:hypothetical protein [Planctomycetaceae bacterium]
MSDTNSRMDLVAALRVLHEVRADEVIITSMGNGREWQQFAQHPLDFVHVPSSMGQTQSWGLGLALAQPSRRIVACCGDGSLLMNLGSLVTIANAAPSNFTLLVFDNGVYEVTGGQPTPASTARRLVGQGVNFASIANECGFRHTERITNLDEWKNRVDTLLNLLGPVCAVLEVAPQTENYSVRSPGRPKERVKEFAASLKSK